MRVLWLSGLVILLDQTTKLIVAQTMYLGQQISLIGDWLKFTYTENPGMAFGITFGPKAMVTVFSIIATILIAMYLVKVRKGYFPYRASLGLILGGALGNIIDRVFYGVLLRDDVLFVGRVVDFIHVNVWSGFIHESVPVIGGTYLSLFPIWNVADMAIVCGVVGILVFQQRFHLEEYHATQLGGPTITDADPVGVLSANQANAGTESPIDPADDDRTKDGDRFIGIDEDADEAAAAAEPEKLDATSRPNGDGGQNSLHQSS